MVGLVLVSHGFHLTRFREVRTEGNGRGKGGDDLQRREFRLARTAILITISVMLIGAVAANRDDAVQAQRLGMVAVIVRSSGTERQVRTAQTTVSGALKDAGVVVEPLDKVTPALSTRPTEGMVITVVKVTNALEAEKQLLAFDSVKTFTNSLKMGQVKQTASGTPGEKLIRYLVTYEDGKPVKKTAIGTDVVKKPVNRVVAIGSRGQYTSRGEFRTRKILKMWATAYEPGPRSCGKWASGRTACGLRAGYGVVAVDPRVISLGTKLYIEGYGYAIAGDRGRAIKGKKIDLGFPTVREALKFGSKNVIVHVLSE
jgi:3D (Asp-Asp-Asp) domain-containing protein